MDENEKENFKEWAASFERITKDILLLRKKIRETRPKVFFEDLQQLNVKYEDLTNLVDEIMFSEDFELKEEAS